MSFPSESLGLPFESLLWESFIRLFHPTLPFEFDQCYDNHRRPLQTILELYGTAHRTVRNCNRRLFMCLWSSGVREGGWALYSEYTLDTALSIALNIALSIDLSIALSIALLYSADYSTTRHRRRKVGLLVECIFSSFWKARAIRLSIHQNCWINIKLWTPFSKHPSDMSLCKRLCLMCD